MECFPTGERLSLIHISDLSWGRVSDPKEVVELDQKLNVVILDFDDEKKDVYKRQVIIHPESAPRSHRGGVAAFTVGKPEGTYVRAENVIFTKRCV